MKLTTVLLYIKYKNNAYICFFKHFKTPYSQRRANMSLQSTRMLWRTTLRRTTLNVDYLDQPKKAMKCKTDKREKY